MQLTTHVVSDLLRQHQHQFFHRTPASNKPTPHEVTHQPKLGLFGKMFADEASVSSLGSSAQTIDYRYFDNLALRAPVVYCL